jgi:hypothetical protein
MNMDELKKSALTYKKLLSCKYLFRLMKAKSPNRDIDLRFNEKSFFHLAGLHYVNLVTKLKSKTQDVVFREILADQIALADLTDTTGLLPQEASKILAQYQGRNVGGRIKHLQKLEHYLDTAEFFYDYDHNRLNFYTEIKNAHTLIKVFDPTTKPADTAFAFVIADDEIKLDFLMSFFPQDSRDYTKNQSFYYLRARAKVVIKDETGNLLPESQQAIFAEKYHRSVSEEEKIKFLGDLTIVS